MSAFDYHTVDVFTDRAYAGNPLAVVLDADVLSSVQMQQMAREFNLSETTFVLPTTADDATYRLRIFTPSTELPFAGHPSIGTAWLLAQLGRIPSGAVVQECGAGLLPVVVDAGGATLTGGAVSVSDALFAAPFAEALGYSQLDHVGTQPRWCGCGIDFGYLHVRDESLAAARPDADRVNALCKSLGKSLGNSVGGTGLCAFSFDGTHAHSRVFAAGAGVDEDPATGSAALGLGVFLVASGLLPGDTTSTFTIAQGAEIGRPSRLTVTVRAEHGRVVEARVAGQVVRVADGTITPPTA